MTTLDRGQLWATSTQDISLSGRAFGPHFRFRFRFTALESRPRLESGLDAMKRNKTADYRVFVVAYINRIKNVKN